MSDKPIIYLAGPDVFLPNAQGLFAFKRQVLESIGYEVNTPLDVIATDANEIFKGNILRMQESDIILANLEAFRGTEPDSGTVFEVGFGVALGKQVITYNNTGTEYSSRVKQYLQTGKQKWPWSIESFGLKQNLMISCSVTEFETFENSLEFLAKSIN